MRPLLDIVTSAARREQYLAEGLWDDETLVGRVTQVASGDPDRVAVVDTQGGPPRTYAELERDSDLVAAGLREIGLVAGDVASLQLPNRYEAVVCALAIQKCHGVINPLLPNYRRKELEHVFTAAHPKVIFTLGIYRGFDYPALVREVVPRTISLARLNEVLRGLAREGVSLRSPVSILESLATVPPGGTGDAAALVEHVRSALGEALVTAHLDAEGRLPVVELESLIEDALRDGIRHLGDGRYVAIEPALSEDIVAAIRTATIPPMAAAGQGLPVLLTHKDLRRHLRQLVEASLPELPVVAYSELPAALTLLTVGRASVEARGAEERGGPRTAPHVPPVGSW